MNDDVSMRGENQKKRVLNGHRRAKLLEITLHMP